MRRAEGSTTGAGGADVGAFVLHLFTDLAGEFALLFDAFLLLAAKLGDDALFFLFSLRQAESLDEGLAFFDEVFAAFAEFAFHALHAGRGGRG